MERTPPRTARLMPSAPCAWAATSAPDRAASSTAARICSSLGELGGAGHASRCHDGAGSDQFHQVRAAVQHPAYGPPDVINTIGHAHPELIRHDCIDVGGQAGHVASAAGTGHIRACDPHPGACHPALVDRIAQRHIDEGAQCAHITHRGEASQQGVPRVAHARQRLLRTGPHQQFRISLAAVGLTDQMSVTVDHAGQQSLARQVHESRTLGRGISSGGNTGDALPVDDDSAVGQQFPGHHIEQQLRADDRAHGRSHPATIETAPLTMAARALMVVP